MRNSADGTWFLPYTASIDFDPVPVYESIDVPVLAILGEADPLVPARETAAILERVKVEKNKDITVAILAGADHNVNRPTGPRPVPEYAETMIGWVREKLAAPVPGARSNTKHPTPLRQQSPGTRVGARVTPGVRFPAMVLTAGNLTRG